MKCPITITSLAIEKLKYYLEASPEDKYIRVQVSGGLCNGYAWGIDLAKDKKDRDFIFDVDGVQVIIDPISCQYLEDTNIDWVKKNLNEGFKFSSQSVTTCGCGKSFAPK